MTGCPLRNRVDYSLVITKKTYNIMFVRFVTLIFLQGVRCVHYFAYMCGHAPLSE